MKAMRIVFGVVFVGLGLFMLVVVLRQGGANEGQAMLGPLGLMGAGALSIASGRRKEKKW